MTADERRIQRIRHDAKLFGWRCQERDGQLVCQHEGGRAALNWPMVQDDASEAILLTLLRLPLPMDEAQRHALRERQRRRQDALASRQDRAALAGSPAGDGRQTDGAGP